MTTCKVTKIKTMENLIGKKVRGFRFDSVNYNSLMDKHIGKIGVIKKIYNSESLVKVKFKKNSWHYPLSEIEKHLVEEFEKEKFESEECETGGFERGELVEVRDDYDDKWTQSIFLTEIEGAEYPFICVSEIYEKNFKNNELFSTSSWKYIRKLKAKRKHFSYEHINGEVLIYQQESEDENSFNSIEQIIRQLKDEGITEEQFTVNKK